MMYFDCFEVWMDGFGCAPCGDSGVFWRIRWGFRDDLACFRKFSSKGDAKMLFYDVDEMIYQS